MKRLAIIGAGKIGSIYIRYLAAVAGPDGLKVYNRSPDRSILALPGVVACTKPEQAIVGADILFLCVPSSALVEYFDLLADCNENPHVVCISMGIRLVDIGRLWNGRISRVLPTILSEIGRGTTFMCSNPQVKETDRDEVRFLLSKFTIIVEAAEEDFEALSDLSSCAPALICEQISQYVDSIGRHIVTPGMSLLDYYLESLQATIELVRRSSTEDVIEKVCTPGGASAVGVQILRAGLPGLYESMITAMNAPHSSRKEQFAGLCNNKKDSREQQ